MVRHMMSDFYISVGLGITHIITRITAYYPGI